MKDGRDGENKVDENLMLLAGIALLQYWLLHTTERQLVVLNLR